MKYDQKQSNSETAEIRQWRIVGEHGGENSHREKRIQNALRPLFIWALPKSQSTA